MNEATCAVCKKKVQDVDQAEHLATNHLGPHYFWIDGMFRKSPLASMTGGELKRRYGRVSNYQLYQRFTDAPDRPIADGESVDLTQKPDFYVCPPATM